MAGQIGYNGFRVRVYDNNSAKTLTDCVVVATHNGKKYNLPYDPSQGDNRLEVASVGLTDDYIVEVTRSGYRSYTKLENTGSIVQVPLHPMLPILEQCNILQKIKENIKDAITDKGVYCDDNFNLYAGCIEEFVPKVHYDIKAPVLAVGMTFEVPYYEKKGLGGVVYEIMGTQPNRHRFYFSFYTSGSSILEIQNMDNEGMVTWWQGNYKFKTDGTGAKYIVTNDKQL